MRTGRFAEAWQVSDRAGQLRAHVDCSAWPRHQQFIWRGEPLAGRRVLVRCYHGLGDTLQFVRFLPRLREMASAVYLWVQPALVPLLESWSCIDRVLPLHDGQPDIDYDIDIELAELMHALRVTPDALAANVPYLHAEALIPDVERAQLRVGLVWAAGEWDARRSIPCAMLSRFTSITGIEWLLLQRGPALSQWHHAFGRVPEISNIVDEARVLRSLDLLITVDTCSAHLAGGLGIPVWTLLQQDADWRWMQGRADTPWYPTMQLIRQAEPGSWDWVLDEVERRLTLAAKIPQVAKAPTPATESPRDSRAACPHPRTARRPAHQGPRRPAPATR
jgi:hypothetical protein